MAFRINRTPAIAGQHGLLRLAAVSVPALALISALSACDKTPSKPPTPTTASAQVVAMPTAAGSKGTSVPEAAAVLASAPAAKIDPAAGRSNTEMSRTQESTAMPLPGQNNDHSAAITLPKQAAKSPAKVQ